MVIGKIPAQIALDAEGLAGFCARWRVVELSFFGSVLREDFRTDSDIDILLSFAPDARWGLFDMATMRDEAAALLGRDVDIVERSAIRNPFRLDEILRTRRVLYAA
jgi:predicted nucleotidyltransferase